MGKKEYRLSANPKRTKRPLSTHPELFHKDDFTETERRKFASQQERNNKRIKEGFDVYDHRSCKPQECTAALEKQRHRLPTCKKIKQCSWAIYLGIDSLV
jgi:hypothetical protein